MAPTTPTVSHLLFADDSLLSVEGAELVSNLLGTYCGASGQRINHKKSSVFFSRGCPDSLKQGVMQRLNVHNESLSDRYLELPTDVGHSTMARSSTFGTECGRK